MTICDFDIPCKIFKSTVENHQNVKNEILKAIDKNPKFSIKTANEQIYNSDYFAQEQYKNFDYVEIVIPILKEHQKKVQEKLEFKSTVMSYIWFQQYKTGDFHGWHTHGKCMFSNVYYVELSKLCSKTTFRYFGNEFDIDVSEGDIITFPSSLQHCSKPNISDQIKTVISFNTDMNEFEN